MSNKIDFTNTFLTKNRTWEGHFTNFVNRKNGIIQEGKILVKVTVDKDGSIYHENAIFDKNDKPGPYTGSMKIKIEGNKVINLLKMEKDEQSGTIIKNHNLEGFVGHNHIHFVEHYDDIDSNGQTDKRRNSVHYYFLSEEELIMIMDVYVNNELLVFANTILKLKENSS